MDNVDNHTVITTDYNTYSGTLLGYSVDSVLGILPVSVVEVRWSMVRETMISRLKVTLVMTMDSFANYFQII